MGPHLEWLYPYQSSCCCWSQENAALKIQAMQGSTSCQWWQLLFTIISGWWFGTFFYLFHILVNNNPNWLRFFKMIKTTNQIWKGKLWCSWPTNRNFGSLGINYLALVIYIIVQQLLGVYIYICIYIYISIHIYICIHIYIYIYIYIYTDICVYIFTDMYIYIYIYIHIYICIHIYSHIYIYTFTYTYIYNVIYVSVCGIGTGMVVSACLIILWHVPFLCFRWLTRRMILKDQENLVSKVLPIPAVHDAFSLYEPCYALEKKQQQHGLCSQFLGDRNLRKIINPF